MFVFISMLHNLSTWDYVFEFSRGPRNMLGENFTFVYIEPRSCEYIWGHSLFDFLNTEY